MMKTLRTFRSGMMRILFLFAAGTTLAADSKVITVVNNSGADAADLHAYFHGSFGNLYVDPFTVAATTCPIPSVPTNFTVTDSAVIEWGATCVPPGGSVTFIAKTVNGPLVLDSVCWTDIFNNIIDCQTDSMTIRPGPGPGPQFGAFKIQVRCQPRARPFYTGWRKGVAPRPQCWARWCCIPTTDYFYRIVYCPFAFRFNRFFEFPPWIPLTPWRRDGTINPRYFWQFWTPIDTPICKPEGPAPDGPFSGQAPFSPFMYDLDPRYSDDGGQTFRPAADLTSSFFDVFYEIQLDAETPADYMTLQEQLMAHAPGYQRAANALFPLFNELQQVNAMEPHPVWPPLINDVFNLGNALANMAANFGGGMTGPPFIYQVARDALQDMAMQLNNHVAPMSPRYANAAANLLSMVEGMQACIDALTLDPALADPVMQDIFRWGLFNSFQYGCRSFAMAVSSHVRTRCDLGSYCWHGLTIDPVHVITQSHTSREIDELYTPLTERGEFDLDMTPELTTKSGMVRMWFKLPTYLAMQVDFMADDGAVLGTFTLTPGDVNGDNCVDATDSGLVELDIGMGGPDADSVPSTDVDGNGLVDDADLQIVIANMGQCGDPFTPLPLGCCVGLRGDPNNDGAESNILDLTFAVDRIFRGGPPAVCFEEGNPNGDLASLNILDLTYFVDRIFRGGPPPVPCPAK